MGFELVGIVPVKPVPDITFFQNWLSRGYHGTMTYLEKGMEKRADPEKILPGVRSVICCGMNYHTGQQRSIDQKSPDRGWISAYAWGEDYHELVGDKLQKLEKFIHQEAGPTVKTKSYTDTGAILERSYAARAGLGWIGKNSCLINNGIGSFFFLGEILTTLELDYDKPTFDQCGSCNKCLDACPTGALVEPYLLDARRCIAYLTVEYRGELGEFADKLEGNVAGCDICQEVCPYNEKIPVTAEKRFYPREGLVAPHLETLIGSQSPVPRIKQKEWERNLKVVDSHFPKTSGKPLQSSSGTG
ncbi:MAG: tRNA epoxyqueuosine(34) reductase QueG [Deltaproteobacteria bacterium]|nr:tRNA epoxyqueuosine(34) reductase QueG [Deltaproteobacteria bacterium]